MATTWLRKGRLSNRLTQKELSERSNISIRYIQRTKNGEVITPDYTLKTLAAMLELSFEEFMKSARIQNIQLQENEDLVMLPTFFPSTSNPQRMILSFGICMLIILVAWAFLAQYENFAETTFEPLAFSAIVLALITATLFFLWRKND